MSCCQESNKLDVSITKSEVDLTLIDDVLKKHKNEEGSLITVLQKTQDVYGYLPEGSLKYIALQLGIKPAKVFGVATFYTQFRLTPMGKYVIMLCQGTACHVNGSEQIESAICEELKIEAEETTDDGLFTLTNAACLGCCSLAPVMMINGQAYGPLTPEKAISIVKDIYSKEMKSIGEGD